MKKTCIGRASDEVKRMTRPRDLARIIRLATMRLEKIASK
jgi:hypothetical protein